MQSMGRHRQSGISRSSQCHPRGKWQLFTIGLLPVRVLGHGGMSPAGWINALSPRGFGIFIISGWACEYLTQSQWLPGQVKSFSIRCIKSLFCYLLCELTGSVFAKFCVHAVARAGCSEQTCRASFAAASVSHSLPGTSPGPHTQPSLGPSWFPCSVDGGRKHLPFGVHWNWMLMISNTWGGQWYKIRVAKHWFWGYRGKGSLEANRNLQKDHCNTRLCCGTLRNTKLRFSCHLSMSEHFIHCFPMELSARHLRKRLGPTGEAGRKRGSPTWGVLCTTKLWGSSSPALSAQHCPLPGAVSHLLTHISLCGVSACCHWRESYSWREKCSLSSTLSSEIEHGCKTLV